MSVYYQDLTRILTPWNYLSVSPAPQKHHRARLQPCADSPRPLLDSPSPAQDLFRTPLLLDSDADNFLQSTPFESQFVVSVSPGWLQPLQEVSPIVRASSSQEAVAPSPSDVAVSPVVEASYPTPVQGRVNFSSGGKSQLDDYRFTDADAEGEDDDDDHSQSTIYKVVERENSFLRRLHVVGPGSPVVLSPPRSHTVALQSPCKLSPGTSSSSSSDSFEGSFADDSFLPASSPPKRSPFSGELAYPMSSPKETANLVYPAPPEDNLSRSPWNLRASLPARTSPVTPEQVWTASLLSPLTPLTPLTPPPVTLTLRIPILPIRRTTRLLAQKRRLDEEPTATPFKRARISRDTSDRRNSVVSDVVAVSPSSSSTVAASVPTYSTRSFPQTIVICPKFPLFYRRYPISSYFQPPEFSSPLALFNLRDPGGLYNHPRSVFDLYTPRFVKGKGTGKLGLCPICVEPTNRGGENKKNWLAMKFSAFNYHLQYSHGISAATGRPFPPPSDFQIVPRPNAAKKERSEVLHGKCQKCRKWVPVEGVKDVESKVKELVWWKHAASCYHDTPSEGDERDCFEKDDVFAVMEKYHVT